MNIILCFEAANDSGNLGFSLACPLLNEYQKIISYKFEVRLNRKAEDG